ncbi:MAG: hypothetical protein ABI835_00040 [Chloroflexota bacterium]
MVKRQSSDPPDPFDDELFDDPLENPLDRLKLDDLQLDEIEEEDDPERAQWRSTGTSLSVGQIVGGAVQVILMAVVALAIFLAIGFGVIFAGQRLGVVAARALPGAATSVASVPTQAPAALPTSAPQTAAEPTTPPAALPSATPDSGCPTAPAWWNSQQIRDNYVYFTQQALDEARGSERIAALLEQMRIRRNFVSNFGTAPCLSGALDALLRGFDATIESARALNSNDQGALAQQQATASSAFAELTVALWTVSANADPAAPPALGVVRNSGASCGGQSWYSAVKPHSDAFANAANQLNVTSTPPDAARTLLNTMQTERDSIAAVETPVCAAQAQTLLLGALDSRKQIFEQQLAGSNANTALSEYSRQNTLFKAWVQWLGVN